MDWLGRKMYPRARPFERRSRMQIFYLLATLVLGATGLVAAALLLLNRTPHR